MSEETWAAWAARSASVWSTTLQEAWDDAVALASDTVQAMTPTEAQRVGQGYYDLLVSMRTHVDMLARWEQWGAANNIDPNKVRALAVSRIGGGDVAGLSHQALENRVVWHEAGFGRQQPSTGFVPVIVAGVTVGLAALCWAWVRTKEAANEATRIAGVNAAWADVAAGKVSPDVAQKVLGSGGALAPPASSGASGGMLMGGLVAAALVGVGIFIASRSRG